MVNASEELGQTEAFNIGCLLFKYKVFEVISFGHINSA